MKLVEGLLRYDTMDTEQWCFDMGYQIISVEAGMQIRMQFRDDRFENMQLWETPDGELTVVFGGRKRKEPRYVPLEKGQRYLAKMSAQTVDDILDNARLLDVERELNPEKNSEPDTNAPDADDFYF